MKKLFGSSDERELKKLYKRVEIINGLEPEIQQLTDEQLKAKTSEFKS
ncbi:hypothetical protein ABTF49_19070, partial [Acinetobacter baumannii]